MENCGIMKNRSAFQRNFTYYYKNNGLQNQSVLYRKDAKGTESFLRSQHFSKDGTTSLGGLDFSKTVQK
jgi:prolyl oligopeptidase